MVVLRTAAALAFAASAALAAQQTCDPNNKCPSSSPCCSSYGQCGTGAYCLGGCDPRSSFNLQSCMPAPACKSGDFQMNNLDDISPNTVYLGDASSKNWVSSGTPAPYQGNSVLLTMAPNTVGTLLSSTHYVWYGKVSATLTTSQGAGVVTAFILMSDVKDEIDFEFVGVDLEHAQSNFYFQGITDYNNGKNLSVSNTVQNTHTYEIDWQPDQTTWSIDGQVLRTLKKSDTYNDTDKAYHYPQTPARVQLSLWPAGLASNGQGTIDWAGGLVNWDNTQAMANGYYYAMINDVNVDCYDPPSDAQKKGSKVYSYTDTAGTEGTVQISDANSILASFQANGNNQQFNPDGPKSSSGTSSASSAATPAASNDNTVPGMTGSGSYGNDASSSSQGTSSGSSGSSGGFSQGTSGGSSGSGSSGSGSGGQSGFSQGTTSSNESTRVVAGSLVALVAFFAAAMMI